MAKSSKRNTGAFILGGVVGGLVGAAVTLWNTPKSGDELRTSLSGESSIDAPGSRDVTIQSRSATDGRFSNPVLSFVERAAAPIVGVELGKLAKDDPDALQHQPVRSSAADARPPSHGEKQLPHDEVDVDHQHVATVDELTSPPPQTADTSQDDQETSKNRGPSPFPDLEHNDRT